MSWMLRLVVFSVLWQGIALASPAMHTASKLHHLQKSLIRYQQKLTHYEVSKHMLDYQLIALKEQEEKLTQEYKIESARLQDLEKKLARLEKDRLDVDQHLAKVRRQLNSALVQNYYQKRQYKADKQKQPELVKFLSAYHSMIPKLSQQVREDEKQIHQYLLEIKSLKAQQERINQQVTHTQQRFREIEAHISESLKLKHQLAQHHQLAAQKLENAVRNFSPYFPQQMYSVDKKQLTVMQPVVGLPLPVKLQDPRFSQQGITFQASPHAPVFAPASGRVAFVGPFRDYGSVIIIEHRPHLHSILVGVEEINAVENQEVQVGMPIGYTKSSTPATLYYEVQKQGSPISIKILK